MSRKALVFDLFINGLLPWIGYEYLTRAQGWTEYHSLLAVTVIPGLMALVGIIRKGKPDTIATVSLVTILLSLGLAAATDDTRLLQIRESYITALIGLIFVGSSLIGKPILWLLARSQSQDSRVQAVLEEPQRKKMLSRVNLIWGMSFLLEFALKLYMIATMDIATVLALSPVMFYGVTGITVFWSFRFIKKMAKSLPAIELEPELPEAIEPDEVSAVSH